MKITLDEKEEACINKIDAMIEGVRDLFALIGFFGMIGLICFFYGGYLK